MLGSACRFLGPLIRFEAAAHKFNHASTHKSLMTFLGWLITFTFTPTGWNLGGIFWLPAAHMFRVGNFFPLISLHRKNQ